MSLQIMNKVVLVVIAIAIIIGVSVIVISSDYSGSNPENLEPVDKMTENEPKSFTVGLEESVGFSERP